MKGKRDDAYKDSKQVWWITQWGGRGQAEQTLSCDRCFHRQNKQGEIIPVDKRAKTRCALIETSVRAWNWSSLPCFVNNQTCPVLFTSNGRTEHAGWWSISRQVSVLRDLSQDATQRNMSKCLLEKGKWSCPPRWTFTVTEHTHTHTDSDGLGDRSAQMY